MRASLTISATRCAAGFAGPASCCGRFLAGPGHWRELAMFSLVDALYLHPFQVKDPSSLVHINSQDRGGAWGLDSYADTGTSAISARRWRA